MKPLPRISDEQREGVRKLLNWCVHMYQIEVDDSLKSTWKKRIDFLAELQKKQSYNNFDKKAFNLIREEYYKYKLG